MTGDGNGGFDGQHARPWIAGPGRTGQIRLPDETQAQITEAVAGKSVDGGGLGGGINLTGHQTDQCRAGTPGGLELGQPQTAQTITKGLAQYGPDTLQPLAMGAIEPGCGRHGQT